MILALEKLTQDYKFQASVGYTEGLVERMGDCGGAGWGRHDTETAAQLAECLPNTREALGSIP